MKEEIKDEIINEILNNKKVIKGDGSNFYGEKITIGGNIHYIHHSTLDCPTIHSGVQRNWYNEFEGYNTYCNICMDDYHITAFHKKFFSNE